MRMPKIKPFDIYADKYEEWFERNKFVYDSELLAIRKLLPEKGEGIEPSSKMGEIARDREIEVVKGVAEALPFCDSTFDFALMVTTICFLDNVNAAFPEASRILKPDGCLVIGFIDKDSPIGKLYQQHKEDSMFYKLADFYSVEEVILLLKRAGFKDFYFTQMIFHNLAEIREVEPIKDGYGEGSFVVIKGVK